MNLVLRFATALLFGFLLTGPVQASTGGIEQMNRFIEGVERFQANFEQSVFNESTNEMYVSEGVFYLQRPNRFRWDYQIPEEQLIVADGRQVWLYDPELEQVSVQSQKKALRGTPAMLLISGEPITDHFTVVDLGERGALSWVELTPHDEEGQFSRILLAFADNQLQRIEMADQFGQITRFRFFAIDTQPVFNSGLFTFTPPLNTDIYNQ
ncbi:MAG: outer membrane lipoprotein chaperone LolA [Chromatiales bacterium]|nr:outer membrane lipoprotein chaperone LolA [Chromatiales bacterium]